MDLDLPTEFDAVVLGTGMCECIVAAALARSGLQILHTDRYDNYGGDWASYNFSALQQWITSHVSPERESDVPPKVDLNEGETLIALPTKSDMVSNVIESILIPEGELRRESESSQPVVLPDVAASSSEGDKGLDSTSEVPDAEKEVGDPSSNDPNPESTNATDTKQQQQLSAAGDSDETVVRSDSSDPVPHKSWSLSNLKGLWRKFNIDLMPKLLYCRGPLVELLISSDVAKYCEFRSVSRVLTVTNHKLEKVPCSRADVFASHNVSVVEKRMLMKLLTFCLEYDKFPSEFADFIDKPFVEFLRSKKLTDTVRHYIQHAIAMVPDTATTVEGLASTQRFLQALGRYGNTAFLWPIYGSGELPQCFARMCAVFGGIYCLRRQATAAILDKDNKLVGVIMSNGQRISTKWLIMEASYASTEVIPAFSVNSRISRAVLLTDRSLQTDKQEHITLLNVPMPGVDDVTVTIYELSSISMACPDDLYVVHLTCRSVADSAKADLQPIVDSLFRVADTSDSPDDDQATTTTKPRVLWSLYFNVNNTSKSDLTSQIGNVIVVGGPDEHIDYDHAVAEAKQVFEKICPGEEFLPRAPNVEDIIFDDGEACGSGESGFETSAAPPTETSSPSVSEGIPVDNLTAADDATVSVTNDEPVAVISVDSAAESAADNSAASS